MYFVIYGILRCYIQRWQKEGLKRGFEEIKDLVRGTITVDHARNVWDGYQHFKDLKGVQIIEIKSLSTIKTL